MRLFRLELIYSDGASARLEDWRHYLFTFGDLLTLYSKGLS